MKPNLYICHTAYQVLVDLLRASRTDGQPHTMVLSAAVPEPQSLAKKLEATGAVKVVIVDETRWPGTVTGPFAARRARRAFEKLCGWRFTCAAYNEVRIHNDWSVLGRYLQDCHAGYILCEDTFASTLGPDQHLVTDQRAAPDFAGKQRTGKGYLYWGDSPWCAKVESEDAAKCTLFPASRLVTDSKRELLESLTDAEKAMVRSVFLTQPLPENAAGATLLLPRSFVEDGLMTQAEQNAMFKAVAAKYTAGPLFIKTHPRDTTDYHALFPDAVILERTMPSEVLNFCLPFKFARAVTVQSFVLRAFTAADEKILLTLDEAKALIYRHLRRGAFPMLPCDPAFPLTPTGAHCSPLHPHIKGSPRGVTPHSVGRCRAATEGPGRVSGASEAQTEGWPPRCPFSKINRYLFIRRYTHENNRCDPCPLCKHPYARQAAGGCAGHTHDLVGLPGR